MIRTYTSAILLSIAVLLPACTGGEDALPADGTGPTVAPSPTEVPLPYLENFEDGESCFETGERTNGSVHLEDGALVLAVTGRNKLVLSPCDSIVLDNFVIEMDVFDATADQGLHYFGLQLRKEAAGNGENYVVRFGLGAGAGQMSCVGLADENSFKGLTQSPNGTSCWVDLPAYIDPGGRNHIEITVNGPEIRYVVNGIAAGSITDTRLTRGSIGLLAGTQTGDSGRIIFDNIRISAPDG